MSKGGGAGGGGTGGRSRSSDVSMKNNFLRNGLTGHAVPQSGLRPESFAHLRAGGAVHGGPVTVKVTAKGNHIVDGRHRITIARERGDKTIHARVIGEGPRGGVRWKHTGHIKI